MRTSKALVVATSAVPVQSSDVSGAGSDRQLVELWLGGRPERTRRAYAVDAARLLRFVGKPLRAISIMDLQGFAATLAQLAPASQCRALSVVKSLLAYAQRTGYLAFNVGAALRLPRTHSRLAQRILTEGDTQRLIALEPDTDKRAMLHLLYGAGLRCSELTGLTCGDLAARPSETLPGQVTVLGKGDKARSIPLPASVWSEIAALALGRDTTAPLFIGRQGKHLAASTVWRIVRAAAGRASIAGNVSPHWLRHCHASHALDRGCPAPLLRDTMGHASLATTSMYSHARPNASSASYLAL